MVIADQIGIADLILIKSGRLRDIISLLGIVVMIGLSVVIICLIPGRSLSNTTKNIKHIS